MPSHSCHAHWFPVSPSIFKWTFPLFCIATDDDDCIVVKTLGSIPISWLVKSSDRWANHTQQIKICQWNNHMHSRMQQSRGTIINCYTSQWEEAGGDSIEIQVQMTFSSHMQLIKTAWAWQWSQYQRVHIGSWPTTTLLQKAPPSAPSAMETYPVNNSWQQLNDDLKIRLP